MSVSDAFQFENGGCIGVDVGGTFTDAVLTDGIRTWRAKAPTTPGEIGEGVLRPCELAARRAGAALDRSCPRWAASARHHGGDQRAGLAHRAARRA